MAQMVMKMLDQNAGLMLGLSLLNSRDDKNLLRNVMPALAAMSQQQVNQQQAPPQFAQAMQNVSQPYQSFSQTPNGYAGMSVTPTQNGVKASAIGFQADPAALGYSDSVVPQIAQSIARLESGGRYSALGPMTNSGDRAYGRYQVMGNNIPVWTKEVLGQSLTPQQFVNDPQAQDKVALAKMNQYYQKYGTPHDVASMWFSGRPARSNFSRDVLGTSVPSYVKNVVSNL
jgi:hypothetical protein